MTWLKKLSRKCHQTFCHAVSKKSKCGRKVLIGGYLINHDTTVEPRFNEVPMDWANWFVISRVRYIENLDITNDKQPKCSLYQGIVNN